MGEEGGKKGGMEMKEEEGKWKKGRNEGGRESTYLTQQKKHKLG